MGELDALKARLELTQSAHNRIIEEKEMTNKELERLLEKYDRYGKSNKWYSRLYLSKYNPSCDNMMI